MNPGLVMDHFHPSLSLPVIFIFLLHLVSVAANNSPLDKTQSLSNSGCFSILIKLNEVTIQ